MSLTLSDLFHAHPALEVCRPSLEAARELWVHTLRHGGKLLLCGNGGSAADCDHIAGELLKGFLSPRPLSPEQRSSLFATGLPEGIPDPDLSLLAHGLQGGLPALSLPAHAAALTAVCNDTDPALCFAQLVWALGKESDTLVCLSTSGGSRNTILAAKTALAKGLRVVALTGEAPSPLSALATVTIQVPAGDTYRVQEYHLPVYHYLCAAVEEALFP